MKNLKKIVFVFKTHLDIGFTELSSVVIESYMNKMLDDVLEVFSKDSCLPFNNHYVWTMPAWLMYKITNNPDYSQEKRNMLDACVRKGQLVWHALPYTTHTEACGLEEFIRGFDYACELSQKYGRRYHSAKMTDVPGHTWMLPSLLAKAGVRFLHLGCNESCTPPAVPMLFWWEGPDGSRILTFYSKDGYGTLPIPPDDWILPTWLCMKQTNDNHGTPSIDDIGKLLISSHEATGADCIIGSMDDFYDSIKEEDLSSLPVIRGDLGDSWIQGIATYPEEIASIRQVRRDLRCLEISYFESYCKNSILPISMDTFSSEIENAYLLLNLFNEHTWGMDVKTHLGDDRMYDKARFNIQKETLRYRMIEHSWDEQRNRIKEAVEITKRLTDQIIPAPKERETKKESSYSVEEISIENKDFILSASVLKGGIFSLVDKNTSHEWVQNDIDLPFGGYLYDVADKSEMERFSNRYITTMTDWIVKDLGRIGYLDCPHRQYISRCIGIDAFGGGEIRIYYAIDNESIKEYGNVKTIELTVILQEGNAPLQLYYRMLDKQETPFVEQGNIVFPFATKKPHYIINKLGAVMNPTTDIVKDANHVFYAIDRFAQVIDEDASLTIVTHDVPLLSIGMKGMFEFEHAFGERASTFYWNIFNNMWGTNFPQWIGGDFTARFSFFSGTENVFRRALDYDGSLDISDYVKISANATLLSVKTSDRTAILHIHEIEGKNDFIEIVIAKSISTACSCDLYGDKLFDIDVCDRKIVLNTNPHELHILELQFT